MNCPFCDLDKEKTRMLEEKKHVFTVLSNPRLMPGHTLVIPKRHVERLSDLSKDERGELFDTAIEYQNKILEKVASGCDINQHHRPFLSQSKLKVNHLHIHLRPREFKDTLYETSQKFEVFEDLTREEGGKFVEILSH